MSAVTISDRFTVKTFGMVVAVLALLTAGCGGSGDDNSDSGNVIEIKANNFRFSPDEITVPAGQMVTIRLKNTDEMEHDLEVQGLAIQREGGGIQAPAGHDSAGEHEGATPQTLALHAQKGKTAALTFMAEDKGTYEVWCTISGHKEQGMVAKLIVV